MIMKAEQKTLFDSLGFTEKDFVNKKYFFPANHSLKNKTDVYLYESKNNSEFSFYIFSSDTLSTEEIKSIHNRVWNEYKIKLFFTITKEKFSAYPALTKPKDFFSLFETKNDINNIIERIDKKKIDSGYLWLEFYQSLKKHKNKFKTVHEELIGALIRLREKLVQSIGNDPNREIIVQALIDRTLFIKFLEDKHIINSYFYRHYFGKNCQYKNFLENNEIRNINKLFLLINTIFDNSLFDTPKIKEKYLKRSVRQDILSMLQREEESGQLSLFDFEFDILPVEFIGHIYQAFLSEKKKQEGIVYTPENLARMINKKVIQDSKYGKILDPACGSGVFLVLALRQLIQNNQWQSKTIESELKKRIKILTECIYGIEKEPSAHRITFFSLYLELFNNIDPEKIKNLIIKEIQSSKNEQFKLFSIPLKANILHGNSLDIIEKKFSDKKFDFIVGNPPWRKIKDTDEENRYWETKQSVVGFKQLSQLFLIKLEDWQHETTRFGFVINSSNFTNEKSDKFRDHFFNNYKIDEYYDLSRVKDMVFENATESASIVIFSKPYKENNEFPLYQFEYNQFSKLMGIVYVGSKDVKKIIQSTIVTNNFINLSNYGNSIINKLKERRFHALENFLKDKFFKQGRGVALVSKDVAIRELKITKEIWDKKGEQEKKNLKKQIKKLFLKTNKSQNYNIPYIDSKDISPYRINLYSGYLSRSDRNRFDRAREEDLFKGKKILYNRKGKFLSALYSNENIYFSDNINGICINSNSYPLIVSILNSKIINYYINTILRKRVLGSYPEINISDINKIPIPVNIEPELFKKITSLSKKFTNGELEFNIENQKKMDGLIYDLYDLNILERDRVDDYFIKDSELVNQENLRDYCKVFYEIFSGSLKKGSGLIFEIYNPENTLPLNLIGIKINLIKNNKQEYQEPTISDTLKVFLSQLLDESKVSNLIYQQNIYFGRNSIYIIKENLHKNWSKSQAADDVNEILGRVSP